MKLIVGLGNPGEKYRHNRHNIGFRAVDALNPDDNWREKFSGLTQKISTGGNDVVLLKPQTFMNLSGDSVQAASKFYKIAPKDILVIHDELDLPLGKIKLKAGGGHAGHNGLRSIIAHIGAEFERLRIGINHPGDKSLVSHYVLSDFNKSEEAWISDFQLRFPIAIEAYLNGNKSQFIERLTKDSTEKGKPIKNTILKTPNHSIDNSEPESPFSQLKSLIFPKKD